jgi:hypothetical protein
MLLADQTVQDFFQEANWQGLKIISNDSELTNLSDTFEEISVDCHFGLTVEEYFSFHNWQGIVRRKISSAPISQISYSQPVFSLAISVEKFFQQMVWQKQLQKEVKIATPPSLKPKESPSQKTTKFNVQDLSDLL